MLKSVSTCLSQLTMQTKSQANPMWLFKTTGNKIMQETEAKLSHVLMQDCHCEWKINYRKAVENQTCWMADKPSWKDMLKEYKTHCLKKASFHWSWWKLFHVGVKWVSSNNIYKGKVCKQYKVCEDADVFPTNEQHLIRWGRPAPFLTALYLLEDLS